MKRIILLISGLLAFSSLTSAQAYNGYADNLFLRQQPNARAEAMGRGNAALTGDAFGMFYNPAVTSFFNGAEVSSSYLNPNGLYSNEIGYTQIGVVYNCQKFGAIGFSYLNYSYGTFRITTPENPEIIDVFDSYTSIYMLNYSYMIMDNFSAGINISFFNDKFLSEYDNKTPLLDIGFLKKISIASNEQNIYAALSCGNILNSAVKFKGYNSGHTDYLPVVLHVAGAYELLYNPAKTDLIPLAFTLCAEYQDVLSHKYYTRMQVGAELSFLEILKVRAGHYDIKDPYYYPQPGADNVSAVTYGFGLSLPFDKFMNNIPLELSADYSKLPTDGYHTETGRPYPDYTILTVNLNVKL